MDNWGDPWADHADTATSPTKDAVTSPIPPAFATAPTILGGFLDDAGWGNEDESFGDWSVAISTGAADVARKQSPSTEPTSQAPTTTRPSNDTPWSTSDSDAREGNVVHEDGDWAGLQLDAVQDDEHVVSETSETSTTVQANDTAEHTPAAETANRPQQDENSSARTSTSPSEASHNDVSVESPRTSYEEERGALKASAVQEEPSTAREPDAPGQDAQSSQLADTEDKDNEEVSEEIPSGKVKDIAANLGIATSSSSRNSAAPPRADRGTLHALEAKHTSTPAAFAIDSDLFEKLFPPSGDTEEFEEVPGDPIYSTSARKAWYRLTRNQTMREFNHGNDDDNYIRVTWVNANIRSEVNKIVGRWAREDRISGTGPGARASFYWDSPAPIDSKPTGTHSRQRSSKQVSNTVGSVAETGPTPLSTTVPAAFSWSSATASHDPWHQSSPGSRSTSIPIAPIHPAVIQVHKQDGRAVSLNLTSREPEAAKHARNMAAADETPIVANLISPPTVNTNTYSSDPWAGIRLLDRNSSREDDSLTAVPTVADDEDDWGEMVSSPTVSTPTLTETTSQNDTRNNTLSSTATTPQSMKFNSIREQSPDAMHASPIVRLKSTISPTSALFKANPFVPLGVEQGPVGPAILKSTKRSVSNSRKTEESPEPERRLKPTIVINQPPVKDASDDCSAWQLSVPGVAKAGPVSQPATPLVQETFRPTTPPPPPPFTQLDPPNIDAWADADFSFFESAPPTHHASQTKPDPSDPTSIFETRARSTSTASSAKNFTRSPPRKVPTPPIQPLTGATSSAQRRKMEEDAVVLEILGGLPDLSYMLR